MSRELTRKEKAAIRKLVVTLCANYDREYGCLPLDCECYMLGKCWTGAYCRYFYPARTASRTRGLAPSAASLFFPMAGHAIARRPAPRLPSGGNSGIT